MFKEYADQLGKSGESGWMIRGGHRLWVSPEEVDRTYAPDNGPVNVEERPDGSVRLKPSPDAFGIQKEIDLRLSDSGSNVTVVHRLRNVGSSKTTLAPWALTVMAPGGVEIIPQPPSKPHPGSAQNAKSAEDFGPNRELVLWPYFDFEDPRWHFGNKYITLRHAHRGATKIGLAHTVGWVGYLNNGTLFVKRVGYERGQTYPDRGCNYETFSNEDMVEMESLGPLVTLEPGSACELVETWSLVPGLGDVSNESDIERIVLPRVTAP